MFLQKNLIKPLRKEVYKNQRKFHKAVCKPYKSMITWVYHQTHTIYANTDATYCASASLIIAPQHCEPYVYAHEIGHFLYDQLEPLQQKQLETALIRMCSRVSDITTFVVYYCYRGVNPQLYSVLSDAYTILYNKKVDYVENVPYYDHPEGYGKANRVFYATTEAFAGACEYFLLGTKVPIPEEMFEFFCLAEYYLKQLSKDRIYHRSK